MTTEQKARWVTSKPEDVRKQIIELAKQGMPAERIGLALRDQHSIPKAKLLGIRIKQVLEEAKIWQDSEHAALGKKVDILVKHSEKHKHDYSAKRSLLKNAAHLNKHQKKK